jgi:hypothetical protein
MPFMSEPQTNSLNRFRKQPGRLVLEARRGCEAPAGCGGVVLRWRNPLAALPFIVSFYSPFQGRCFFDGNAVECAGVDLSPGPHVLTISFASAELSAGLFMFAAVSDPAKGQVRGAQSGVVEQAVNVLSLHGDGWISSTSEPPPESRLPSGPEFDGPALSAFPTPALDWSAPGGHACHRCTQAGAGFLGVPAGHGKSPVWVRKAFIVPAPVFAPT